MNQKHYSISSVLETALWNPDHPPSTPNNMHTYRALTVTYLGTITVTGQQQFRFQSHQAKLVHTYFHPHTPSTTPGWHVDSSWTVILKEAWQAQVNMAPADLGLFFSFPACCVAQR